MSYREMYEMCGLIWDGLFINATCDQFMERLCNSVKHWELHKHPQFGYDVVSRVGFPYKVTGSYPDPRMAFLEAVMMVEQGQKWNGKEWVKM